ncbi:MAG TPA: glycosyl hydrolase [Bryobacteraceae bacterium]
MRWRNIGPFRGGRVAATAGVTSEPNTFYMGTAGGGVYKTTTAGQSWFNVTDGFVKTSSVGAIEVSASDPKVVYVGMGESTGRFNSWHHGDGVYRSSDAGRTWQHVGLEATQRISAIRIDPRDPNVVYVAAEGALYGPNEDRGVYRSKDGGQTWKKILYLGPTAGATDLALDRKNPSTLYAVFWDHQRMPWGIREVGPNAGVYKSTDGGDSWRKSETGLPKIMGKVGIAISANSNRLYAIVATNPDVNDSEAGLYRSDDAGATWSFINPSVQLVTRSAYYGVVVADPQNPDVLYIMEDDNYKSTDGGVTFEEWSSPHGDHHALWISPKDSKLMVEGDDGGATVTMDGGKTWTTQYNQSTAQIYRVNSDNQFPYRVYGAQQDNTTVGIASWSEGVGIDIQDWFPVGGGETGFIGTNPDDPELVYSSGPFGQVTEYSVKTRVVRDIRPFPFTPAGATPTDFKYRFKVSPPLMVSRHDPKVIYVGAQKVLRSSDRGQTWEAISPDLTQYGVDPKRALQAHGRPAADDASYCGTFEIAYCTITYMAESPLDANELWTGSDDGVIGLTRDGGKNWTKLRLPLASPYIESIEVSPHDPGEAYVAATRFQFNDLTPYFFKTENYGKTWERIGQDLPMGGWARVVREDPVRRGLLYAGTESGIFMSFDGGQHWQTLQRNLPVTCVSDLQVHGTDLLASTSGRGLWILDDVTPLRQMDAKVFASAVHLFNPEPAVRMVLHSGRTLPDTGRNPVSGAVMDFFLAKDGPVSIEILDSSGNVVRRLSSEARTRAETHSKGGYALQDADLLVVPIRVRAGMNRVAWDLRRAALPSAIPGVYLRRAARGRFVTPGSYSIRLTAAGQVLSAPLEVLPDPRSKASAEAFAAQDRLLVLIEADLTSLRQTVLKLISVHDQIVAVVAKLSDPGAIKAGKSLADKLENTKNAIVQHGTHRREGGIPPNLLYDYLDSLDESVDTAQATLDPAKSDMYPVLHQEWLSHKHTIDTLLGPQLEAFNKGLSRSGQPPIVAADR